jgi:hypothetical protein
MELRGTKNALDADDQWALVDDAEEAEADECNATRPEKDDADVGVDMSAAKSECSDAANTRSASCNGEEKVEHLQESTLNLKMKYWIDQ